MSTVVGRARLWEVLKQCARARRRQVLPLEEEAVAPADHDRNVSAFEFKEQVK
jgi:hypothetical protein